MAGRKVFTSGEILTAADVNSFLMDQSVMVFADSTARSSAIPTPTEGMVTYREDANRVEVFDGSTFGPIGGILQVVSTTKTDTFSASIAAGAFSAVTGLSATITPSTTSSKIFVMVSMNAGNNLAQQQSSFTFRLMRDATAVGVGDTAGSRTPVSSSAIIVGGDNAKQVSNMSANLLDSPSATTATTYSVELGHVVNASATATFFVNRTGGDDDLDRIPRSVSSITLMEVAV